MHSRYMDRMRHEAGTLGSLSGRRAHGSKVGRRERSGRLILPKPEEMAPVPREIIAKYSHRIPEKETLKDLAAAAKSYFAKHKQQSN